MQTPSFQNTDPGLQAMIAGLKPGDLWESALRSSPSSQQYALERVRIPEFLAAGNSARASYVLDYEDWDTISYDSGSSSPSMVNVHVYQQYPLWVPLHRAFYSGDSLPLDGEFTMENHYDLYIEDMYW
jgi:hypothetical protein